MENPARAAVWFSVILMLYQACLPEGLTLDQAARDIEWRLIPSGDFDIEWADVIGNVIPYGVFGHFVFVASWRRHRRLGRASRAALLGTLLMAFSVELVQLFNLIRGSAAWDMLSGAIGAVFALFTGTIWLKLLSGPLARWLDAEIRVSPLGVAAAGLGALILLDAARPFYLVSSVNALWDNVKHSNVIPFRPGGADIRDQLDIQFGSHQVRPLPPADRTPDYWGSQAERSVLYLMFLGLLVWRRRGRELPRALLAWATVLVAAELIVLGIVGGRADITHLVVGMIGIPLALMGTAALSDHPRVALGVFCLLSLAYILIADLRPYELDGPTPIRAEMFIPLIHHYGDIDVMQLWNIVEAMLVYVPLGAAIYALDRSHETPRARVRWPSAWAVLLICGVVALSTEVAQLWIPARTPGIEDVLYAMCGGYVGVSVTRVFFYYSCRS